MTATHVFPASTSVSATINTVRNYTTLVFSFSAGIFLPILERTREVQMSQVLNLLLNDVVAISAPVSKTPLQLTLYLDGSFDIP